MKLSKKLASILLVIVVVLVTAGAFYWNNLRGIWPVFKPVTPRQTSELKSENSTGIPLQLPPGFSISIFAQKLPGARVIAFDDFGNMWVSQTSEGTVSLLEIQGGKVIRQNAVFRNLRNPHGLAFDPDHQTSLFIAEENKVSQVAVYSEDSLHKLIDLPAGSGHFTRTIGFGPDKKLYVSIGSSCNVCNESDSRRARIFSMNKDGSDFKEYARGLRNSVFFRWHPDSKKMWATDMGRDLLGDNTPPDEINIIEEEQNYGWPICYGKNIHDDSFDKKTYIRNPCMDPLERGSHVDLQAHSAPLGLDFVAGSNWPEEYQNDVIVAFHGSWNRTVPTGYKLVRVKLDSNGNYISTEDFISGWLSKSQVYGRPVDVAFGPDGALYVTDDKAGLIYRISYPQ